MTLLYNIDLEIFGLINGFAGSNLALDEFVVGVSNNDLVKGMVPVSFIWYLWFNRKYTQYRPVLLSVVMTAAVAIVVGRLSALLLPYRPRPIHAENVNVNFPTGVTPGVLDGWSSFPSDHAVFYFFLAVSLFLISRRIGLFLLLHALLIVSLPRVFAGFHYPSDIVAGAVVGAMIALILVKPVARYVVPRTRFLEWEVASPQTFYVVVFIVSFQMASMFNSLRAFLSLLKLLAV